MSRQHEWEAWFESLTEEERAEELRLMGFRP